MPIPSQPQPPNESGRHRVEPDLGAGPEDLTAQDVHLNLMQAYNEAREAARLAEAELGGQIGSLTARLEAVEPKTADAKPSKRTKPAIFRAAGAFAATAIVVLGFNHGDSEPAGLHAQNEPARREATPPHRDRHLPRRQSTEKAGGHVAQVLKQSGTSTKPGTHSLAKASPAKIPIVLRRSDLDSTPSRTEAVPKPPQRAQTDIDNSRPSAKTNPARRPKKPASTPKSGIATGGAVVHTPRGSSTLVSGGALPRNNSSSTTGGARPTS